MNKHVTQDHTQQIVLMMNKRHYKEACNILIKRIEDNLASKLDYLLLARCLRNRKQYSKSYFYLRKVDFADNQPYGHYYQFGRIAYLAGKHNVAKKAFEKAHSKNDKIKINIAYLAIVNFQLGEYSEAVQCFRKIGSFRKKYAYLCDVRAFSLLLDGQTVKNMPVDLTSPEAALCHEIKQCRNTQNKEGESLLRTMLKELPLVARRHQPIGRTRTSNSDLVMLKSSDMRFAEFLQDPERRKIYDTLSLPSSFYSLCSLFQSFNLDEEARHYLFLLIEQKQISEDDICLAGNCFLALGMLDPALRAFSHALELDADTLTAYYGISQVCDALGDKQKALKYIKHHLNIVPRDVKALSWIAMHYIQAGDSVLAAKQLNKLERLEKGSPTHIAAIKAYFEKFGVTFNPSATLPDYHYIDWSSIEIPNEFLFSQPVELKKSKVDYLENFKQSSNVITALILREMTGRFGRSGIGYLWAIIQQLVFVSVFAAFFEFRGKSLPYGVDLLGFLITGISAFFIFRNTTGQMKTALTKNKSLLHYRQVSPFAIYSARSILEFTTGLVVFCLLVCASMVLGETVSMTSLLQVILVIFMLNLFGAAYGILIACVSIFFTAFSSFEQGISRVLFFTSGLFYYANELPPDIRDILMWNPLFNLIELLREGFFSTYTAEYASREYVAYWTLGLLFAALVVERTSRRRALEA